MIDYCCEWETQSYLLGSVVAAKSQAHSCSPSLQGRLRLKHSTIINSASISSDVAALTVAKRCEMSIQQKTQKLILEVDNLLNP